MKKLCILLWCGVAACGGVSLTGSGSTFIAPIATKWCQEYQESHPDVHISYRAVGSGRGISDAIEGVVDFAATDGPMTKVELESYKAERHSEVLHLPAIIGAVVPAYNLPGPPVELNFTPEALAGIFLGTISRWNDPELSRANHGVALPNAAIVVVHRSDASGTSYVWADYLAKVSLQWKLTVGVGTNVSWPVGVGASHNEGVAETIGRTPYSLGYLELGYAIRNRLVYGNVRNASGNFIKPDLASVTTAAAETKTMPEDFRVSITNAAGANSYPVSSFSWFLIPRKVTDAGKRQALIDFVQWVLTEGQAEAARSFYAPLPPRVREMEFRALSKIQ